MKELIAASALDMIVTGYNFGIGLAGAFLTVLAVLFVIMFVLALIFAVK